MVVPYCVFAVTSPPKEFTYSKPKLSKPKHSKLSKLSKQSTFVTMAGNLLQNVNSELLTNKDARMQAVVRFQELTTLSLAHWKKLNSTAADSRSYNGPRKLTQVLSAKTLDDMAVALKGAFTIDMATKAGFIGSQWLAFDRGQLTTQVVRAAILTLEDRPAWVSYILDNGTVPVAPAPATVTPRPAVVVVPAPASVVSAPAAVAPAPAPAVVTDKALATQVVHLSGRVQKLEKKVDKRDFEPYNLMGLWCITAILLVLMAALACLGPARVLPAWSTFSSFMVDVLWVIKVCLVQGFVIASMATYLAVCAVRILCTAAEYAFLNASLVFRVCRHAINMVASELNQLGMTV